MLKVAWTSETVSISTVNRTNTKTSTGCPNEEVSRPDRGTQQTKNYTNISIYLEGLHSKTITNSTLRFIQHTVNTKNTDNSTNRTSYEIFS